MSIFKDIPELVLAEVISQETADKIQVYYNNKASRNQSRLLIIFGILGSLLVGLGIILILAHNWDELPRSVKTFIAFIPLILGQLSCGYVLLKKQENAAWKESSATFLFITIASSISLVAQIYNISGDFSKFLLTWMLLGLPLVYVMRSSSVSLLYIFGITWYAIEKATFIKYWSHSVPDVYYYWLLIVLILPHYYILYKKKPQSSFLVWHNWIIPISIFYGLFSVIRSGGEPELMFVAYMSLFGLYFMIGDSNLFKNRKTRNSGYQLLGTLGTVIFLIIFSFDFIWEEIRRKNYQFDQLYTSDEFITASIVSLVAIAVFVARRFKKPFRDIKPIEPVFIIFLIMFIIGLTSTIAVIIDNILVLGIGILTIRDGAKTNHLGILNYGLLIIAVLVACRFFDTNLSYITRGVLFLIVGVGFYLANFLMFKHRNVHE